VCLVAAAHEQEMIFFLRSAESRCDQASLGCESSSAQVIVARPYNITSILFSAAERYFYGKPNGHAIGTILRIVDSILCPE